MRRRSIPEVDVESVTAVASDAALATDESPAELPPSPPWQKLLRQNSLRRTPANTTPGRSTDPAVQTVAYQAKGPGSTSKAAKSTGKASGEKASAYPASEERPEFDPIAVNGKFFEGWKKPKLAVVISGRQDGYLEPCGCAGIDQQKGGISRRQAPIADLEGGAAGPSRRSTSEVGCGGLASSRRFNLASRPNCCRRPDHTAVGFGPSDLRLSAGEIVAAVAGADPKDSICLGQRQSL